MKNKLLLPPLLLMAATTPLIAQNFNGVSWTPWTTNSPHQDRDGSGNTPSTSGATNNQSTYTFSITTTSTSSTQRQEWQYERQDGLTQMDVRFRISSAEPNFDRVSLVQCHDDQTGSKGVFSIYQVRRSGNNYVFGVQGDTTEADNGYSQFSTRSINLNTWYRLNLRTNTNGKNNSFEHARLYSNSNQLLWENIIEGGGDSESYYKLGAYRLTGGSGKVTVSFDNIRFWTGSTSSNGSSNYVFLRKRNANGFAMDGNNGGKNGQNVHLWTYNSNNNNQRWVEINRGGGHYSYQKYNTNFALDGGNGGKNGQNLYIWSTNSNNQNQQWRKISTASGTYRLQKRNSSGFSIDGNKGGSNGQNVYLWNSNSNNQNQQWFIQD